MTGLGTNPLARPIVIVGAPRSGTTVLGHLLARHPALAHVDEPRITWRYGNDRKSDMLAPEDARPEVCRHIRETFAGAVLNGGKQRLLEKSPSNSLRMGFVEKVLPGCLFVHIMRDGIESTLAIHRFWGEHARGVDRAKFMKRVREISPRQMPYYVREFVRRTAPRPLAGMVRQPVWGPRLPGMDELLKELKLIEVCALQWRTCVESARHFGRTLPADRYMECKLEELSTDKLESILKFCQLEDSPEVWQAFENEFDRNKTSHRRAAAEQREIDMIVKWIEPTMQWLAS